MGSVGRSGGVRENQFIFPQKSEIMAELSSTSSQLSTAPPRFANVKQKNRVSQFRPKKGNKHTQKSIYGCLKRFRLSINIFYYKWSFLSWMNRLGGNGNRIAKGNLVENAISRETILLPTCWMVYFRFGDVFFTQQTFVGCGLGKNTLTILRNLCNKIFLILFFCWTRFIAV